MGILQEIRTRRVFFDGAMGSLLQAQGLKPGELPETWNLTHPERIEKLHLGYLEAGADVVTTNTFGANRFKYHEADGYDLREIVARAVGHARRAVDSCGRKADSSGKKGYVALDIGPTGKLLKPLGDLDFEDACGAYREIVKAGAAAGADCVLVETMSDSHELKAAVLAAKEACDLPVLATAAFNERGKLLTGGDVESVVALLEGLGADVIGMNCGLGPGQMRELVKKMAEVSSVPLLVNPNAGLPRCEDGVTRYDIDAEAFAGEMAKIALYASALGGCCGTTPEHIEKLAAACRKIPLPEIAGKGRTVVSSYSHAVVFAEKPVVIGERINPTGKPKFRQALKNGDMEYILKIGVEQQERRAEVLDVNVGIPDINEPEMMTKVVQELQSVLDLPLQIDTSNPEAMERAMRVYNGKPLVNSVNGKREAMETVFPLVKRYGGVVVALCLDENGIPETADGRIAVAKKILETAAAYGIGREDVLIDALCMTVGSEKGGALTTLETVRRVRDELGAKTVLGVSNISFGLPMREYINTSFFTMAMQNGLSAAIINPDSKAMMAAYDSFLALSAIDENCRSYTAAYAGEEAQRKRELQEKGDSLSRDTERFTWITKQVEKIAKGMSPDEPSPLEKSILRGMAQAAAAHAREALLTKEPLAIIHDELIPALGQVGKGFESGTVFLPQLLMSAEAAKAAFAVMKESMEASGQAEKKRGKVILATVKGDIHDIGKNIVKVLLENYGFEVIDLGRDVPPETVAGAAAGEGAALVGLSALMTTTVPSMAETIRRLKKELPGIKVMVGGAVLTREYADSIGADCYCRDAMASVRYAELVLGQGGYVR